MTWEFIVSGAFGAALALLVQAIVDQRHLNRVRRDAVSDRIFEFQRDVLIALDQAIVENTRLAAYTVIRLDNGQWDTFEQEYERFQSNASVKQLTNRVMNEDIRAAANACSIAAWDVFQAHTQHEARQALPKIATASAEFHRRCGEEIRKLYSDLN